VKSGFVANTRDPVPDSSLHAVRMFALENVQHGCDVRTKTTDSSRDWKTCAVSQLEFSIGVVEFVIILPVYRIGSYLSCCPAEFVTTFAATIVESMTTLPVVPEKLARLPGTRVGHDVIGTTTVCWTCDVRI